ncbi:unnamed protein product [Pleuronectes platessa]|uniref:Uncharacterized protein n=1 Tax=Pleuronectes platessa TaxID=8262 RepID=A0A9N7YPP8_PLEPL|nr:unnamed protein product [Pleuronectes platessa]
MPHFSLPPTCAVCGTQRPPPWLLLCSAWCSEGGLPYSQQPFFLKVIADLRDKMDESIQGHFVSSVSLSVIQHLPNVYSSVTKFCFLVSPKSLSVFLEPFATNLLYLQVQSTVLARRRGAGDEEEKGMNVLEFTDCHDFFGYICFLAVLELV